MPDTWPGTLPQKMLVDGYGDGMGDGRLVSRMDAGPPQVRRRSSAMPRPLTGRMNMTAAQIATLKTFVTTTLIGGTLSFNFPDPVGGATIEVMFAGGLPQWANLGGDNYSVSLDLMVMP